MPEKSASSIGYGATALNRPPLPPGGEGLVQPTVRMINSL